MPSPSPVPSSCNVPLPNLHVQASNITSVERPTLFKRAAQLPMLILSYHLLNSVIILFIYLFVVYLHFSIARI